DSEDEGSFTLSIPDGQSVVGAAVTDTDGSLSAESAGGSVEYDKVVPVYHAIGSLDTEITDPSGADDLVLVGGPSVNNLVDDLVQEGKVEGTEVEDEEDTFEWQEDTPEIQLVEDAFAEDQTALIVAGWDADETRDAAASVQEHLDAGTLEGATAAL
ncbi:MAG: S-layer protein, partial [Candidatus Aenigmatarchaeota archaeon]